MGKTDSRIDAYIEKSAAFAQPILRHLREIIHRACPDVSETIKWGFPHFEYMGILCSMASFKQHCAFGFWKAAVMSDPLKIMNPVGESGMGHLGKIQSLNDLPADDVLTDYLKEAVWLNEQDVKKPAPAKAPADKTLTVPEDLLEALARNESAAATFEKFSYSHKKEYVEWIEEAKTRATREKRLATTIEWLTQGKGRNWKYTR